MPQRFSTTSIELDIFKACVLQEVVNQVKFKSILNLNMEFS